MGRHVYRWTIAAIIGALPLGVLGAQGDAFSTAVRSYATLHRSAAAGLSSAPGEPAATQNVERILAERIQSRRANARAGEVFGSDADRLRGLVRTETAGSRGAEMRAAIEESNVHGVRLRVNHRYPPGLPRVTMPAQILDRLPPLPAELEYRFLGRALILIDTRAGLVVDVLHDALPAPERPR